MVNLYITEQGARLERLSERLVVRKNGTRLLEVPVKDVERVVIFGAVQVTTQALSLLLEKGIDVNLLTIHGKFKGKLCPGLSKNIDLRLAQHDRLKDERFCLLFAQNIVGAKMKSQQAILRRYQRNHDKADFTSEIASITSAVQLLLRQKNINSVRTIEGMATAAYFRAFGRMVQSDLGFAGRNKHPPLDPVNGLLSLGYVLLARELAGLLEARGLDPFMGFYHTTKHGRRSLALDMLEEFRHSAVDRLTLATLNTRAISADDFENREDSRAYLKAESFRRYVGLYEDYLTRDFPVRRLRRRLSFRELFRIQVEKLARAVKSGEEYEPFAMK